MHKLHCCLIFNIVLISSFIYAENKDQEATRAVSTASVQNNTNLNLSVGTAGGA